VATVAVVLVAVAGWFAILPHGGASTHGTALPPARAAAAPPVLDAAESGLLPWHLAAPLSRAVAVPGSPGQLIVLSGLTPAGTSASGVYALRTATGAARQIGALSAPLHDAAGPRGPRHADLGTNRLTPFSVMRKSWCLAAVTA
jgi:hypothetical protein